MRNLVGLILIVTLVGAAGCRVGEEGAEGNVIFVPRDCALLVCDFDKAIATGGVINVQIMGTGGFSTAGLDLRTDDPTVFTVTAIADIAGKPTWEIRTLKEGVALIEAFDQNGDRVDFIDVPVQNPDDLKLEHWAGNAVGPTSDATYHEIWQINVGEDMRFNVVPTIGSDNLMGRMMYNVTIDSALEALLAQDADITEGKIYFRADAAGDYWIQYTDDLGNPLDVLFQAQ